MGLLLGGGGIELPTKKTLCQICVNLIGTSWHLVAQLATGVTVSLNKITVNKSLTCFGSRGSEVQILSPRPFKTRTCGNRCRSFFFVPISCQPELGASKEFLYRSAAFSAIKEGLLSSINRINRFK